MSALVSCFFFILCCAIYTAVACLLYSFIRKQHFQIGAYFIEREPEGLSIHGRGSLIMQQPIRKYHSCICQMTSCKTANAREENL